MTEAILKDLAEKHPELIPEPFDEILRELGFDALYYLTREFGGTSIYFPIRRSLFYTCLIHQMKNEFNGQNYKKLARKFGFCERTVKNILH